MERIGKISIFLGPFLSASLALAAPSSLTYQGRIMGGNGLPLEYSSVSFEFRITDPAGGCVLYREQKNGIDMTSSKGVFDTAIGTGTKIFPNSTTIGLLEILSNAAVLNCEGGATYLPAPDDGRKLRVQFHDGTGWRVVTPDNVIRSVPYAAQAHTATSLSGKAIAEFVLKNEIPVCAAGSILTSTTAGVLSCTPDTGGTASVVNTLIGTGPLVVTNNGAGAYTVSATIGTSSGSLAAGDDARLSDSRPPNGSASGDLTGSYPAPAIAANAVTTVKINNLAVTTSKLADGSVTPAKLSAGSGPGQVLRFNGTAWESASLNFEDLVNTNGLSPWPATSCGVGQFLTWVSTTDNFSCVTLTSGIVTTALGFTPVNAANVGPGANQIPQLDASGKLPSSVLPPVTTVNVAGTAPVAVTDNGSGSFTVGIAAGAASGQVLKFDGNSWVSGDLTSAMVTSALGFTPVNSTNNGVTSVGLSLPSIFSVSNSPVTSTGSLTATLASQNQNTVLAAPLSGSGSPSFRTLKMADIKSSNTGQFLTGTSCASGEALVYNATSDTISCQTIAVTGGPSGTVTNVTGTSPISVTNGSSTPAISITAGGISTSHIANGAISAAKIETAVTGNLWSGSGINIYRASGNVGIGTSSPGAPLHVNGNVRLDQICDQAGANCKMPASLLTGVNSGQVTGALGYTPLNKAGDTMTGRLNLSTSGMNIATKDNITTRTDSGFFQTDTATTAEGWPLNGGWYHLLSTTHSNDANYYAMQFSGDFNNSNNVFYRTTNGSGTMGWNRLWHSGNLTNLNQLTNGPGYITGINSSMVTTALGYTPWHPGNFNPNTKLTLNAWNGSSYVHTDGRHYGTIFYDSDDSAYYVDPNSVSQMSDVRANIYYDRGNTAFYLDPAGHSEIGRLRTNSTWDGFQGGIMMQGDAPTITMQDTNTNIRWMLHNNDDGLKIYRANTAEGTDWDQKIVFANNGDIWSSRIGDWLFNRVGQDVRAGTSPNFWNVWLGYNGNWISEVLNQDVRNGASPSFNNPYVNKLRASTSNNYYTIESGGAVAFDGALVSRNVNNQMAFTIQSTWVGGAGWFWRRLNNLNDVGSGHYDPMVLDPAGTLWVGTGYTQASDIRLKKDIESIPDSLKRISELEGVTYYWKDAANKGDKRHMGLIAQEVEKVFPEVVTTNNDGYKAVSYQNLVAPIINALKEVRQWMMGTDERIATLESENKMMKEYFCSKDANAPFCQSSLRTPTSSQ